MHEYKFLIKSYKGILLDTSFLIQAIESRIDIICELKKRLNMPLYIPKGVINELKNLGMLGKRNITLVMDVIKRGDIQTIDIEGGVDDAILSLSKGGEYIVATTDSKLRKKLKSHGVTIVYINKDNRLIIE